MSNLPHEQQSFGNKTNKQNKEKICKVLNMPNKNFEYAEKNNLR